MLRHHDLTDNVLGAFYCVYRVHGYGFSEGVYQRSLVRELRDRGFTVATDVTVNVGYKDEIVGTFKLDIVVNDLCVLEIKAGRALAPEHTAQIINYLKASGRPVGLLLNFGPQPTFERYVGPK